MTRQLLLRWSQCSKQGRHSLTRKTSVSESWPPSVDVIIACLYLFFLSAYCIFYLFFLFHMCIHRASNAPRNCPFTLLDTPPLNAFMPSLALTHWASSVQPPGMPTNQFFWLDLFWVATVAECSWVQWPCHVRRTASNNPPPHPPDSYSLSAFSSLWALGELIKMSQLGLGTQRPIILSLLLPTVDASLAKPESSTKL